MGIANRISSPGHDIQLNTGGQKLKTSFSLRYMIMKLYCVNNKDIAVELRLFFQTVFSLIFLITESFNNDMVH